MRPSTLEFDVPDFQQYCIGRRPSSQVHQLTGHEVPSFYCHFTDSCCVVIFLVTTVGSIPFLLPPPLILEIPCKSNRTFISFVATSHPNTRVTPAASDIIYVRQCTLFSVILNKLFRRCLEDRSATQLGRRNCICVDVITCYVGFLLLAAEWSSNFSSFICFKV